MVRPLSNQPRSAASELIHNQRSVGIQQLKYFLNCDIHFIMASVRIFVSFVRIWVE